MSTADLGPGLKPALVWFKAQAPGFRNDGSSLVTLRLAEVLAQQWDLHLVCLQTQWTVDDPADRCCPPFSSATVVIPAHRESKAHLLGLGFWYRLLDGIGVRPMAVSIESSGVVRRRVADVVADLDAEAGVVEYWSSARVLQSMPAVNRVLLLVDVEHENRMAAPGASGRLASLWRRWRSKTVEREELRSSALASRTAVLSDEDMATFGALGMNNLVRVAIPVPRDDLRAIAPRIRQPPIVVTLGALDWWPNREGLAWFLTSVWPKVLDVVPGAMLHVIGTASSSLRGGQVRDPNVLYTGFVNDLASALAEGMVGVVPTRFGTGVKTKTLEMLSAGLPIVSTTNGVRGTSATIAGALIGDEPEAFAEHVVRLLSDGELRLAVAAAGREALEREHVGRDLVERLLS